jgi:phosphopantetheinyl transferase
VQLWARKEAAVQAMGSGLTARLDQIEVSGHSPVSIVAPDRRFGFSLIIQDLDVGPGYGAAVATPRWCRQVVHRTWMSPN